jgi:hypothetical protein
MFHVKHSFCHTAPENVPRGTFSQRRVWFVLTLLFGLTRISVAQEEPAAPAPINPATIANPTVRAALEMPRKSPADFLAAVTALIDLGEPELAAQVFGELAKLKLTDAQQADLVLEVGPAALQKLLNTPELATAAAPFVEASFAAANKIATDPARLEKLITALGSKQESARYEAFAALRSAGDLAIPALLAAIAKTADDDQQNRLREVLVGIGKMATPALVAALDSPSESVRRQAAYALGQLREVRSVGRLGAMAVSEPANSVAGIAAHWAYEHLTGKPADSTDVIVALDREIKATLNCLPPNRPTGEGLIVLPLDANGNTIALPPAEAGIVYAAHLSRLRSRLNPADDSALRRALVLSLESQAIFAARDTKTSLAEELQPATMPTTELSQSLHEALSGNYHGAAEVIVDLLGERRDIAALYPTSGTVSPLVAALSSPASRVRFAALTAVMDIHPSSVFPGAGRIAPALANFARGNVGQSAVVAYPNTVRAADIAGLLAANGLAGQATNNGFEAVRLAAEPGVELVIIDLSTIEPPIRETLFRLRRQAASSNLPIALVASEGRLEEAQRIADDHCNILAFPRPHSAETVRSIVEQLRKAAPLGSSTAEDRTAQAAQAVKWIAQILADGPEFYDLRSRPGEVLSAVEQTGDLTQLLKLLVQLGTPASQQQLLNMASQSATPIADREAAAKAFDESVKSHGLRITTGSLLAQYDRYNASEGGDEATQKVLAELLDTIEYSRQQAMGGRQ